MRSVIAGLTVFFTMAYAAFANPVILSEIGMPQAPVFLATCLVAGLGSIICGLYAQSPTALAPGMAFNAFLVQYAASSGMTWSELLVGGLIVGVVFVLLSFSGYRRVMIDAIPRPLQIGVIGGIGSLLAALGLNLGLGSDASALAVWPFALGIAIIVFMHFTIGGLARAAQAKSQPIGDLLDLISKTSLLSSIVIVSLVLHAVGSVDSDAVETGQCLYVWACNGSPSFFAAAEGALSNVALIPFVIFVVYMLLADIAGTAYQILPPYADRRDEKINRSFQVDSLANIAAPILGTSPTVYYAENNAARVSGASGGVVAVTAGIGFLALAAVGLVLILNGSTISNFIPTQAIGPALFSVGAFVVAASITNVADFSFSPGPTPADEEGAFYAPETQLAAAISIILTPTAGLEWGLASGLLAYYAYFIFVPESQREPAPNQGALNIFAVFALIAIAVQFMLSSG